MRVRSAPETELERTSRLFDDSDIFITCQFVILYSASQSIRIDFRCRCLVRVRGSNLPDFKFNNIVWFWVLKRFSLCRSFDLFWLCRGDSTHKCISSRVCECFFPVSLVTWWIRNYKSERWSVAHVAHFSSVGKYKNKWNIRSPPRRLIRNQPRFTHSALQTDVVSVFAYQLLSQLTRCAFFFALSSSSLACAERCVQSFSIHSSPAKSRSTTISN